MTERKGSLSRLKFAYLGDGNNVAVSLAQAVALVGGTMALGCPAGYSLPPAVAQQTAALADRTDVVELVRRRSARTGTVRAEVFGWATFR